MNLVRPVMRRIKALPASFLLLAALYFAAAARTGVAVFPLTDACRGEFTGWVGPALVDDLFRKLQSLDGMQVWDPLFLFQADSTGWEMQSPAAAKLHRNRWQWDVAVGGSYRVTGDAVNADLRRSGSRATASRCASTSNSPGRAPNFPN